MNKILSLLGLCKRAGKLVYGNDAVIASLKAKRLFLILLADDLSLKTKSKIKKTACLKGIQILEIPASMEQVEKILGKRTGVIGITDLGFAQSIGKSVYCTK